jgi:hypothetical protein
MELSKTFNGRFWVRAGFALALWLLVFWLLFPMFTANSTSAIEGRDVLFRTVLGLGIMIILFGKTVTDLLFPQDLHGRKAVLYTVLLVFYSLALMSAIIFMVIRVVGVYLNTSISSTSVDI